MWLCSHGGNSSSCTPASVKFYVFVVPIKPSETLHPEDFLQAELTVWGVGMGGGERGLRCRLQGRVEAALPGFRASSDLGLQQEVGGTLSFVAGEFQEGPGGCSRDASRGRV